MTAQAPVITIDGPSGSGKGTISRRLAEGLDWHFLDSGALYRLVGLGAERHGIDLADEAALADYAANLDVEFVTDGDAEPRVRLEGQDVTSDIRTEQAGNAASQVAALTGVRQALLQRQRDFQKPPGLVADGRDMGTTVFAEADLKIYLTASAEERAQRRYKQLKEKGLDVSLGALINEIAQRDARDSNRQSSPLKPADDAVTVDTSELSISEVMAEVQRLCRERLGISF